MRVISKIFTLRHALCEFAHLLLPVRITQLRLHTHTTTRILLSTHTHTNIKLSQLKWWRKVGQVAEESFNSLLVLKYLISM